MLFNSYIFIFLFLPLCWVGFWQLVKRDKFSWALSFLTLCSLGFYAYWDAVYLILLLASILFNFWIAGLALRTKKKAFIYVGVGINLAVLGYFKYSYFFMDAVGSYLGANLGVQDLVLPLGISFFTFHQITYLFDTYHGVVSRANLRDYALYISFFPQLIAGPVVRARQFLPQIENYPGVRNFWRFMAIGLSLFVMGLGKKVIIADYFATHANRLFNLDHTALEDISFFDAWAGSLAYTFQLYFDFSGYSDMALGLALLFGFRLPINFYSPYKAKNIAEFWRRWHMTMSYFFRDYLYIPLGGSRCGKMRHMTNLMLTMTLVGLWHGAGWTFILWGALHGAYLCVHNIYHERLLPLLGSMGRAPFYRLASLLLTFLCVVVGWVLFRSDTAQEAAAIFKTMFGDAGVLLPSAAQNIPFVSADGWLHYAKDGARWFSGGKDIFLAIIVAYLACLTLPSSMAFFRMAHAEGPLNIRFKPSVAIALLFGVLFSISVLMMNRVSEFLYFQF